MLEVTNIVVYRLENSIKNFIEVLDSPIDVKIDKDLKDDDKKLTFRVMDSHSLQEEDYLVAFGDEWVVKEISKDGTYIEIGAIRNIEKIEATTFAKFSQQTVLLADVLSELFSYLSVIEPGSLGWSYVINSDLANDGIVMSRLRTIEIERCNALDVIKSIASTWFLEVKFDTINKVVTFYKQRGEDRGVYFSSQLNLRKIKLRGDTYEFATRLIPIGKEDINVSSVNSGSVVLENYQYSEKVITKFWVDNRYTNPASLKEDGEIKLNEMSKPVRAYSCDIIDLSQDIPILEYDIGDTVTIIDEQLGIRDVQRINKMTVYPYNPEKNTAELANRMLTFAELQEQLVQAKDSVQAVFLSNGTISGYNVVGKNSTLYEMEEDVDSVKYSLTTIVKDVSEVTVASRAILFSNEYQSIPVNNDGDLETPYSIFTLVSSYESGSRIASTIGTIEFRTSSNVPITLPPEATITINNPTSSSDGSISIVLPQTFNFPSNSGYIRVPITIGGTTYYKSIGWSTVVSSSSSGTSSITVLMTNEAHIFAGVTDSAIAGSTSSQIIAYQGTTQVPTTITSITGQPTGMSTTISGNGTLINSFDVDVVSSMTQPNGSLTVTIEVEGLTFTRVFSYAISFTGADGSQGEPGENAKLITLVPSNQIFKLDKTDLDNITTNPNIIVVDGLTQNTEITDWSYSVNGGSFVGIEPGGVERTNNQVTITGASVDLSVKNLVIKATDGTFSDTTTIIFVEDGQSGQDSVSMILSNENGTVATASDGSGGFYGDLNTYVYIYVGLIEDTANWSYSASEFNVVGAFDAEIANFYQVTEVLEDQGYVDITATNGPLAIVKRLTVTKIKAGSQGDGGEDGQPGSSYQLSLSNLVVPVGEDGNYKVNEIEAYAKKQTPSGEYVQVSNYEGRFVIEEYFQGSPLEDTIVNLATNGDFLGGIADVDVVRGAKALVVEQPNDINTLRFTPVASNATASVDMPLVVGHEYYFALTMKVDFDPNDYVVPSTQWQPLTPYAFGDIILFDGQEYECVTPHTSSEEFINDALSWTAFTQVGYEVLEDIKIGLHDGNGFVFTTSYVGNGNYSFISGKGIATGTVGKIYLIIDDRAFDYLTPISVKYYQLFDLTEYFPTIPNTSQIDYFLRKFQNDWVDSTLIFNGWLPTYVSEVDEISIAHELSDNVNRVRVSLYAQGGATLLLDSQEIPMIYDGNSGRYLYLLSNSQMFVSGDRGLTYVPDEIRIRPVTMNSTFLKWQMSYDGQNFTDFPPIFDAWATETLYNVGDFVNYNDSTFRCISEHTSSTIEKDILVIPSSYVESIHWLPNIEFNEGQVVEYLGSYYECLISHTSSDFATELSSNYWVSYTPVTYVIGDIVQHNGLFYEAVVGHTSSLNFATDSENWEATPRRWVESIFGNIVTYEGNPNTLRIPSNTTLFTTPSGQSVNNIVFRALATYTYLNNDGVVVEDEVQDMITINRSFDTSVIVDTEVERVLSRVESLEEISQTLSERVYYGQAYQTNNLVQNGNFALGTNGWQAYNASASLSATNNILTITANGSQVYGGAYYVTSKGYVRNQKIYVRATIKSTNELCTAIKLVVYDTGGGEELEVVRLLPEKDVVYLLSGVVDTTDLGSGSLGLRVVHEYIDLLTSDTKTMEVSYVSMVNLTSTFGVGKEPDKSQMDASMALFDNGWFDGQDTVLKDEPLVNNFTQWKQEIDGFVTTVQRGGGYNLIHNSVGFRQPLSTYHWSNVVGEGTTFTPISANANAYIRNNSISNHGFLINGNMTITQTVATVPEKDMSLAARISKDDTTALLKIYVRTGDLEYYLVNTTESLNGEYGIKIPPTTTTNWDLVVEVENAVGNEQIVVTDLLLVYGENITEWQQAPGEIHNLNVLIDSDGMTIKSISGTTEVGYTNISPYEFAGYYGGVKIFTLNGTITEVQELEIKKAPGETERALIMKPVELYQAPQMIYYVWVGDEE